MKAQEINDILDTIKVDSSGRRRGMSRAIDKIWVLHYKSTYKIIMDARVKIGMIKCNSPEANQLKDMIDKILFELPDKL